MGKKGRAEFGTPKWVANKMKSKGLQKLRWYCQMCQKQCRDQNGFKCHIASESHQRQLLLFGANPGKYLYEFSREFERDFMDIVRRCHGTKRVFANSVYQEYIKDKNHIHMNATRWVTLSGFVRYLGATGKCKVDDTEKGWYITWIDRDPDTIARQEALAKRDKMAKDDDERMAEFVAKQVEREREKQKLNNAESHIEHSEENHSENEAVVTDDKFTELQRDSEKICLEGLKLEKKDVKDKVLLQPVRKLVADKKLERKRKHSVASEPKKKTAIEEIMEEEQREKERKKLRIRERTEVPWLKRGIVVKITTNGLGDKYYKQKGEVLEILDKFKAILKLNSDESKVTVDQNEVETVIPAVGRQVLILSGKFRGCTAILQELDVEKFSAKLKLCDDGKDIVCLPYESFSKLASS